MEDSLSFTAALPLFGVGVLTMLMSCCFCCYLWKLKAEGQRELGYQHIYFKKGKGRQEMCPVCLDEFNHLEKAVLTHCSHIFHHKCLEQWLQESNVCPMCKTSVKQLVSLEERAGLMGTGSQINVEPI